METSELPVIPTGTTIAARLPSYIRLPLICVLSLGSSMLLNTLISEYTGFQLAAPSRTLTENWKIGAILAWRVAQIATAWAARYDWLDLMALTFLTNYPFYYLLNAFWGIPSLAMMNSLVIDVVSIASPFALLRPTSRGRVANTANEALAGDWTIMLLFAGQGVAIYACFFYLSYYLSVSVFMITHFDVQSLEGAHNASLAQLMQHFGINGLMAMIFLFVPTMAAPSRPSLIETDPALDESTPAQNTRAATHKRESFDAATATFSETLAHNLGFAQGTWSVRAGILAQRIAVLAACVFANTAIRAFATVEGTDLIGALGWAGLWTSANVAVGLAFTFLENEY